MRNMKRSILLALALTGASVLFLGAAPGTASAGNCTFVGFNFPGHPNVIWYDGAKWSWSPYVGQCSGVNGVEFEAWYNAYNGHPPFVYDSTVGAYHFPISGGGSCLSSGTFAACDTVYRNNVWGAGCGSPSFWVVAYYNYRIRSWPGSTWGPWHTINSPGQSIC